MIKSGGFSEIAVGQVVSLRPAIRQWIILSDMENTCGLSKKTV